MNLINELRMLAEDLHVNGYNRYSAAMSKAADELGSLERYRTAYNECGNAILAARDELEERCDELSADKGTWYRMSEVFSKRITEVEDALKASEEREQELKSQIAKLRNALICMTKTYKSVSYAQLPPEMHLTLDVLEETK